MATRPTPPGRAQALVRIAQRCWLPVDDAADFWTFCAAAVESSAPHTVLASVTAARLHGLWLPATTHVVHLASAQPGVPGGR